MAIEEIEQLESLDDADITAVVTTPSDRLNRNERTSVRISVPPPIPKQALERRSGSPDRRSGVPPLPSASSSSIPPSARTTMPGSVPPGLIAPPPLGAGSSAASSVPPRISAPPPAGAAPSSPPSSGIYRISDAAAELERLKSALRDLELKVRLRDDLILELKRSLEEQRRISATAERERDAQREQLERAERAHAAALSELSSKTAQRLVPQNDDLKQLRGIGPAFERKLNALGVTHYAQVAAWTEADVARIAEALAILPARIARDGWIESARAKLG